MEVRVSGGTKRFVYTRVKRTLYFVALAMYKNLACLVSIVYNLTDEERATTVRSRRREH